LLEITLHILDVAENGITAGADLIFIKVDEARRDNFLEITIADNGRGMDAKTLKKVTDPFFTSRVTRTVGLGLSLLKEAAKKCQGEFSITSTPGKGTRVWASFVFDHIDRAPVGDMVGTIMVLLGGNPAVDFVYEHIVDGEKFELDTRKIKTTLGDTSLTDPAVIHHLSQTIAEHLNGLTQKRSDAQTNGDQIWQS
jgi:hypothetical protein